jgi:transposase
LIRIERAMTDRHPTVQRRARAIWMLSQGYAVTEIPQAVNVRSRTTIYSYWQRFKAESLDGLVDRPRPGRLRRADAAYCQRLESILAQKPHDLGYSESEWMVDALRDYM